MLNELEDSKIFSPNDNGDLGDIFTLIVCYLQQHVYLSG